MSEKANGEIKLNFYGNLMRYRRHMNEPYLAVVLRKGECISDILTRLQIAPGEITILQCNGKKVSMDYHPSSGDEIMMFNLMSGG